jgi:hypothetical protein
MIFVSGRAVTVYGGLGDSTARIRSPGADFTVVIDVIKAAGVGIIENDMAAFGDEFKRFANSQFPDVKANLDVIHENGNRQRRAMRHLFLGMKALKEDLEAVRVKNQEFLNRQAELQRVRDVAKALRAAVGKADEGSQRAERKENQVGIQQAKLRVDQAT